MKRIESIEFCGQAANFTNSERFEIRINRMLASIKFSHGIRIIREIRSLKQEIKQLTIK